MQPFRPSPVDDDIGDGQHLQQQPSPSVIVIGQTEQSLRVDGDHLALPIVRTPDANRTTVLGGRSAEHLLALVEGEVERVRFALAGVAKDGDHLVKVKERKNPG